MTMRERAARLTEMLRPMSRPSRDGFGDWLLKVGPWRIGLDETVRTVVTGRSGFWAFGKSAAMRWLRRHAPDAYAFAREHCRTFRWYPATRWQPAVAFDPAFGRCRKVGPWGEGGVRWR